MASFSFLQFLSIFYSFFFICHAQISSDPPVSLVLPITKDYSTFQYLTTLSHGSSLSPTKFVVDLGFSSIWVDCDSRKFQFFSGQTISRRSIQCLTAKSREIESYGEGKLVDQEQACEIFSENRITGKRAGKGELVEDLMVLQSTQDSKASQMQTRHKLLFACSESLLLNGLASEAKGMLGFGRARSSLSSQIFTSLDTKRKFSLCLSSSTGVLLFGDMGHPSLAKAEIFRSLKFTPFTGKQNQKHPSEEYLIKVNFIKINGKKLSLSMTSLSKDEGRTELSSVVPYSTMESSIYEIFTKAYLQAAMAMNMIRVDSVGPFGLCFSSKGNGSKAGPNVPSVDFVLQSEMVKWRIHGRNSMVKVNSEVMCLGFVDGGLNPRNPIVIGGHQLEDVLLQFDLETSMLGFSDSLLTKDTSCFDFKFRYMPTEAV